MKQQVTNDHVIDYLFKQEEDLAKQLNATQFALKGFGAVPKYKFIQGQKAKDLLEAPVFDPTRFVEVENESNLLKKSIQDLIVKALFEHGKPAKAKDIKRRLSKMNYHYALNTMHSVLPVMVKNNLIQRVRKGFYAHLDLNVEKVVQRQKNKGSNNEKLDLYIIEVLKEFGEPTRAKSVHKYMEDLGWTYALNSVASTLSGMANKGQIQRIDKGLYTFNEYNPLKPLKQDIKVIKDVFEYIKLKNMASRKEIINHMKGYKMTAGQVDLRLRKLLDSGKITKSEHGIYKYVKG